MLGQDHVAAKPKNAEAKTVRCVILAPSLTVRFQKITTPA